MTQWHQACRIAVELNLLAIQVLVARVVYCQLRKRMTQYQTDFFTIFLYKTVVEIVGFTLVCSARYSSLCGKEGGYCEVLEKCRVDLVLALFSAIKTEKLKFRPKMKRIPETETCQPCCNLSVVAIF